MDYLKGAGFELARRSFLDFCKSVGIDTPYHVTLYCEKLQALEEGSLKRLIISAAPRFSKSLVCSQAFSAYALGRNPKREILLASHSESIAEEDSRKTMALVESPLYPFPVTLSAESRSVSRWHVTGGGSVRALGRESRALSLGGDICILNDLANSESESEVSWKWFREVLLGRVNPEGRILVVSARLSSSDLIGRILENDSESWEYLSLPAISNDGTALWPQKWPLEELEKIRATVGPETWEAQYMQNPGTGETPLWSLSDCPSFTKRQRVEQPWNPLWLEYVSPLEYARPDDSADTVTIQSYDTAGTLNSKPERATNSYHAIVTLQVNLVSGFIAVTGSEKFRGNYQSLFEKALFALGYHNPSIVLVETADPIGGELFAELKSRRSGVCAVRPKVSKRERMLEVVDLIRAGRVHIRESVRQHFDPRKKGNQDSIDALVQGLAMARDLKANRVNEFSPVLPPSIFG